jgi:hypothetical protein
LAFQFACRALWSAEAAQEERFAHVLRLSASPPSVWAEAAAKPEYGKPPLTVECWAKLKGKSGFNILAANEPKESSSHWELYTFIGSGKLSAYLPGYAPDVVSTERDLADNTWHFVAMAFDGERVRLYVDAKEEASVRVARRENMRSIAGGLTVGKAAAQSAPEDCHGCEGEIAEVRLSRTARAITSEPAAPLAADSETIGLWRFTSAGGPSQFTDGSRLENAMGVKRAPRQSLDDLDRESFKPGRSPMDSTTQDVVLEEGAAVHPKGVVVLSLDGPWQMAEGGKPASRLSGNWTDAIPAEVPSSVHTALRKARLIPDPKVGLNDAIARTNSFKTWWFKPTG